jgi:quinol monooxygenase YgiN
MATLFVRHTVKDYKAWKRTYDNFAPKRKEWGVTGASVYRDPENPNDLVVIHRFSDVDDARAFVNSEDLHKAMENSGVTGQPTIWITEDIEKTFY